MVLLNLSKPAFSGFRFWGCPTVSQGLGLERPVVQGLWSARCYCTSARSKF